MNIITPPDLLALFGAGGAGTVAINNSINAAFGAGGVGTVAINNAFGVVAFGPGGAATAIGNSITIGVNNAMVGVTARLDNLRYFARNRTILDSSHAVGAMTSILVPIVKVFLLVFFFSLFLFVICKLIFKLGSE